MFGKTRIWSGITVVVAGLSASAVHGQDAIPGEDVSGLKGAVVRGVLKSPQVNADWYNFEATREAERGAWAGYLPSADVYGEVGREDRKTPLLGDLDDYGRDAIHFSVTQMLFDGFATRDEVARLGYAKLSRYYDFKRSSEEVAAEVVKAYNDTVKYQQLVNYANDNLQVHRKIYDQISERAGGGVSQDVDREQAVARVALAESNLVTEITNLHDVMTRYQRLVHAVPPDNLTVPTVPSGQIPELHDTALELAYQRSPVINAAIENLRSAQQALNATNAPMMPRFDLRYRYEEENDTDGISGNWDEEAIEVVMSYNLYRGGADSARKREHYNLYNAAIEERKQACLNVRQEVMIDFNNVNALEEQVIVLERNMVAQDKTRRAYRDQFDIGKRTLLDLLDSQNEYFDTQRAHISAVTDLVTAQASTLSNMGMLLASLEVDGLNAAKVTELDLDFSRDDDDENAKALCPTGDVATVDRDELFAKLAGSDADAEALANLANGNGRYKHLDNGGVSLEVRVQFEFDSAVISSAYDEELAKAGSTLSENTGIRTTVEGHTDTTGPEIYNQGLSERRANAVRNLLIQQYGVNPGSIVAIGYGETRPVADNSTREGRTSNRRVELVMDVATE